MKTVKSAWVFDIDGVISNLITKNVTDQQILNIIVRKLEFGEPVALNTGRGLEWTIGNIINPIIKLISNKKAFGNFFMTGEKGGVWLTINNKGRKIVHIDKSFQINTSLHNKIQKLITATYPEALKEYERKSTMIALEMTTGFNHEKFKIIQKNLMQKINDLVTKSGLDAELNVQSTRIAIDIQHKLVGKGFAMKRILDWMKMKKINPQRIIAFGDDKSDFEMAQKAYENNFQTEFVYVGGDSELKNIKTQIPIIITKNKFEKGTLEYLKTL
jgi:trehalose-phosphatase